MRPPLYLPAYLKTLALVGVATGLAAVFATLTTLDSVSAIYMLPVLIAAVRYGTGSAVAAALLGALMTTLFYPPLFSVLVMRPPQIVDLLTSLVVALTLGRVAGRVRAEMLSARDSERQIRQLYHLGSAIAAASDAGTIYGIVAEHMGEALQRPIAVFAASRSGHVEAIQGPGGVEATGPLEREAGRFLARSSGQAGAPTDLVRLPAGEYWLLCRLGSDEETDGVVLAVPLGERDVEPAEDLVAEARAILAEGSRSLDRLGLSRAVEERNLRQRTDALRDILMESVSHDLRTPVASIMGAASVIAGAPALARQPQLSELAGAIATEARRLDLRIQNLLDVTRIRSGALQPRLDAVDAADVINAALDSTAERLRERRVERRYGADLPLLLIDPVLVEQALINIIENAAKFGPADTAIVICAVRDGESLIIDIRDEGPGLTSHEAGQMFERFHRGERHADIAGGSGLGLSIAKVFVEACGGRIEALSAGPNRGTTMRISLPVAASAGAAHGHDHEPDDD